MNSHLEDWCEGEVDGRIGALFGPEPLAGIAELVAVAEADEEIESQLVEVLQASLDDPVDVTMGTAAVTLVLGEIGSHEAIGALIAALTSDDEMIVAAAIRALRRIGAPALEALLELLDDPEIDADVAQSIVEALEGVTLHELADLRAEIEARLLQELLEPGLRSRRREAAALALARLGVRRSRPVIERISSEEFRQGNAFLLEAIELLEEHPDGLPCPAAGPWQEDLRWADAGTLPGGELEEPGAEGDDPIAAADPGNN